MTKYIPDMQDFLLIYSCILGVSPAIQPFPLYPSCKMILSDRWSSLYVDPSKVVYTMSKCQNTSPISEKPKQPDEFPCPNIGL